MIAVFFVRILKNEGGKTKESILRFSALLIILQGYALGDFTNDCLCARSHVMQKRSHLLFCITYLGRTLDVPWTYLGRTLDVPWTYLGRTLDVPWTYLESTLNLSSVLLPSCYHLATFFLPTILYLLKEYFPHNLLQIQNFQFSNFKFQFIIASIYAFSNLLPCYPLTIPLATPYLKRSFLALFLHSNALFLYINTN